MLKSMLNHNLTINKQNIKNFNQALQLFNIQNSQSKSGEANLNKSVFMLKNQIPLNISNVNIVESISGNNHHFTRLFEGMANHLSQVKNPVVKLALMKALFSQGNVSGSVKGELPQMVSGTNVPAAQGQFNPSQMVSGVNATAQGQLNPSQVVSGANAAAQGQSNPSQVVSGSNTPAAPQEQGNPLQVVSGSNTPTAKAPGLPPIPLTPGEEALAKEILGRNLTESEATLLKEQPQLKEAFLSKPRPLPPLENSPSPILLDGKQAPSLSKEAIFTKLMEEFSLNPNLPKEHISSKMSLLSQNIATALELLPPLNLSGLGESLSAARDTLELAAHVKDVYIPLPIMINGTPTTGELYIFKDGRNKAGGGKSLSALISLNTANLGKVETFIQKLNKDLNIQFRLGEERAEKIIKSNMATLKELLREYNIQSVTVVPLKESFNVVFAENDKPVEISLENYNFDIRA